VDSDKSLPANRLSSLLLFVTVAWAPFPFGSTDASATSLWCIVLGLALVLARPVSLQRGQLWLLALAAVVVAAYVIVLHEQIAVRPWFSISSPHPLWQESSKLLGTVLPPAATIAQDQPWLALGPPLSMMLTLVCAFIVSLERERADQLLKVVAWSGVAYAAFGIASYIGDPTKVLWRDKQAYTTSLTATFTNRNTAAVYFGTCTLIWQLMVFERLERLLPQDGADLSGLWRRILFARSSKTAVALSMFLLCLAAMLLTGSRAGVVFSLAVMIIAPVLFFRRRWPRKGGAAVVVVAGIGLALVLLETLGSGVSSRFDIDQLADGGRWEVYRSTLRMIVDYPWLGTGFGTFVWSFPAYRSEAIPIIGIWDRAHNTLLELTSEAGIPLASLIVLAWVVVLAMLVRGVRRRRRDVRFPLSGLLIALLALAHSSIDFSLQIPGFAMMVAAVVGCGLAQSFRSVKAPARASGISDQQVSRTNPAKSELPSDIPGENPGEVPRHAAAP
jgi:O-antigen ligase